MLLGLAAVPCFARSCLTGGRCGALEREGGTVDGAVATSPVVRRTTTGELASLARPCHPERSAFVLALPVSRLG